MSLDNPSPTQLLEVAEQAARAAGTVALHGFRTVLEITSKGGTDIVTQYDHAAEEAAIAAVRSRFPTHSFLAEESGASATDPESPQLVWMIDPIDGTHNYASQLPFWCVSVAVADGVTNKVLAGVVYDPLHEELFAASQGGGATVNGKPIFVTGKSEVSRAIVAYDIGQIRHEGARVPVMPWKLLKRTPYVGSLRAMFLSLAARSSNSGL